MFNIVFNTDENYIKYNAVLITSIIKNTDSSKNFKDFFDEKALNSQLGGGGIMNLMKDQMKKLRI